MRKKVFVLCLLLVLSGGLYAENMDFMVPDFEYPYYRIVFPFQVSAENTMVTGIQVNGQDWPLVFAFSRHKNFDLNKALPPGRYFIHVDYAWKSGKDYEIVLFYDEAGPKKKIIKARSLPDLGIPGGEEGYYRIFRLEEPIGMERKEEILTLAFAVPKRVLPEANFLLFDGGNRLDYQVIDKKEIIPLEKVAKDHPVTLTYKIAFPIDLAPRAKKMLIVVRGDKVSAAEPDFSVEIQKEGVGKTVKSERIALEFHPQSGQINTIAYLQEGIKLYNEVGVIHWNPGCFIPGIAWDHSFNWKSPPSYQEINGPHLYSNARRGPLEKIKDVNLEVKYTMVRNAPYFLSETRMQVMQDLGVIALRNDEMVLYQELFDSLIYKDKRGRVVKMTLEEKPGYPDGFVHKAPDDLDWIGLLNTKEEFGFFCLRLSYINSNLNCAGEWLNKAGTYFYAPVEGKYVYWVRPLLYPWAEYPTRNILTYVQEGSFFYEKNAYLLLPLQEGYTEKLEKLLLKLKNPVRIY